ncbi:hypothetical protein B0J18DRAFT_441118 [Chaetomium sp. MPI-SDFR-AT-0129]|nr:hypothetical protein B0J18DRAFT_441118 [Chaetomium sp. MPI-SDFR-AT-0129]
MNHTALNSTTSAVEKDRDWGRWAEDGGEGGLKEQVASSIHNQIVDGNARVHNGNNFYMARQPPTFDRRDADILNWLAPRVSFHQTHDRIREQARIAHYADSVRNDNYPGKWLIESDKFQEWGSGSLLKLWCLGMPGAGKSVLASIVIAHLLALQEQLKGSRDSARVAYLYLSYNEEYTLQELLGSVIKQLVAVDEVVPECVVKVWKKRGQGGDTATIQDFSDMLRDLVRERRALIVVDALDECRPEYRLRLMSLLQPESSNVSLLVTSRLLDEFDEVSSDFEKIKITANSTDLDLFIDHEFRWHPRLKKFLRMDPTLQEEVKNSIKSACDGMFLVAFLQMQSVEAERTLGGIRRTLGSLPYKIDDMYEHTMARIAGRQEADKKLAVRTLSWIVCACRPLTTQELQHALSVVPGNFELHLDMIYPEDTIRDVCGGLVTVIHGRVSLVHYTAQGYFRGRFSDFHATIAQTCISYLSLRVLEQPDDQDRQMSFADDDTDEARNPQELQSYFEAHGASADNRLSYRNKLDKFPFAEYAATMMAHHLQKLGDAPTTPSIAQSLVELLQCRPKRSFLLRVLDWVYNRSYSPFDEVKGEAESGLDALRHKRMEGLSDSNSATTSRDMRRLASGREVNAIHLAAFLGWPPAVLRILESAEAPFDFNVLDPYFRTPLWIAVTRGNWDVMDVILSNGGSIDFLDKAGHDLLRQLAKMNKVDIIKRLITANVKSAPAKLWQASTPPRQLSTYLQLILAAGLGDIGTIQKLLATSEVTFSADTSMFYITAFFLAVEANHPAAVEKMLDSGVDVDTRGVRGKTALHIAAARNYVEVVKVLLARNAAVDLRDAAGKTPYTANGNKQHEAGKHTHTPTHTHTCTHRYTYVYELALYTVRNN